MLADALSRVPRADKSEGEEIDVDNIEEHKTSRLNDTTDSFHSWFDEPEMLECMLNLPEVEVLERINIRRIIPYKEPTG